MRGKYIVPPFFSIITATFNASEALPSLLKSLEEQSCQDFVLLCQDGASGDKTLEIIEKWRDKICISLESVKDTGIYDAWNKAIAREGDSLGEWVLFLGADDFLAAPDVLEKVKNNLEGLSLDVLFACGELIFTAGAQCTEYQNINAKVAFNNLFKFMPLPFPALFIRKKSLLALSFSAEYKIVSDYKWLISTWKKEDQLHILNFLTTYMEADGISSNEKFQELHQLERDNLLDSLSFVSLRKMFSFPNYYFNLHRMIIRRYLKKIKDKYAFTQNIWNAYKSVCDFRKK